MERPPAHAQSPAFLPVGAVVGPWRVVAWAARVSTAPSTVPFFNVPSARYLAQPTDDLYALGVTACRLVTGEYPELGEPRKDETETWQLDAVIAPPALLADPGVDPALRTWILRLLSVRPEERGTARELAEALERAVQPTLAQGTARPRPKEDRRAERAGTTGQAHLRRRSNLSMPLWLAAAAVGLALVLGREESAPGQPQEEPVSRAEAAAPAQPDAGTVGLGDSATTTSTEESPKLSTPELMAQDTLPEPQPGQTRPDAKGHCPRKGQVALNGACWITSSAQSEDCAVFGGQMFKGTCYQPSIPPRRRTNTSSPIDTP